MRDIGPWQFFRVAQLHSPYMLMGLAAVGLFGAGALVIDPSQTRNALAPVLLLQVFAVSSGFLIPARRGYFDLLMTGGTTRLEIAIVHWMVSALPGAIVWIAVALVEVAASHGARASALSGSSLVAFVAVSMIGWAVTIGLPRLSGGVIWLVMLFLALAGSPAWRAAVITGAEGRGGQWDLGLLCAICPFLLIGSAPELSHPGVLVPVLAAAFVTFGAAVVWIVQADIALEAAQ
jgi:hypothetical protein